MLSFVPIYLYRCRPREWKRSFLSCSRKATNLLQQCPLWGGQSQPFPKILGNRDTISDGLMYWRPFSASNKENRRLLYAGSPNTTGGETFYGMTKVYIKSDDLPFRQTSGPRSLVCRQGSRGHAREQSLQFLSRLDERKKRASSEKANERKTAEREKGKTCKDLF